MSAPSFITPGHVRAYQMVCSQLYDGITLTSCFINGEPGVAIVLVDQVGEGKVAVMPLFVAIRLAWSWRFPARTARPAAGGGPRRGFAEAKAATEPWADAVVTTGPLALRPAAFR